MANFRRQHVNKSKRKSKKKSHQKEDEKTIVEEEQMAADQAGLLVVSADDEEEETKKKTMAVLRCLDGVELEVPKAEASRYGRGIEAEIRYGSDDSTRRCRGRTLIRLRVHSHILSTVIRYFNLQQASDPPASAGDAANFLDGLSHATLVDLVLAADYIENQGLLDLACQAVAGLIAGKSQSQIRAMFGIRPPAAAASPAPIMRETVETFTSPENQIAEQCALRALHIVRRQDITAYDPKCRDYLLTRVCDYNIAFFDFDKESTFGRGPPFLMVRESSIVSSTVNFISLKVCKSDIGFPINVFGTVIARDLIDYKCVYLFRREANDSQVITSPDDTLTLIDPHRGLIPEDIIYFEFNLKIKCHGGATKDFSKGLTCFNICLLGNHRETVITSLTTWLSTVKLKFAHVPRPLEASITISVLKGPCELTRVAASTSGNTDARIILYESDSEAAIGTHMRKRVYPVALTRRVVFVPLGDKLVLHLVGDDEVEHLILTLGHDEYHRFCKLGCSELRVGVSWTAIPEREFKGWREVVGNVWLLT